MKNLKKMLASLVAVAMVATMAVVPAFAETFNYGTEAEQLNKVGLYKGISETEFVPDLGTKLDRQTGVVMLLRMFGQEEEAELLSEEQANTMLAKFTDAGTIADWAKKQVAYAVDKGVVKGYEDSTFRPSAGLNGKAYSSLLLQQLGYDGDFNYHMAATKLAQVGGLSASQAAMFNTDTQINKDSLVGISFGVLQAKYKEDGKKLVKVLLENEVVSEENLNEAEIAYAEITSVAAIDDVTVDIGATPELPATIAATYDNGTTADVAVTWPTVDTSAEGEQTVNGTIANTSVTASVKVTVVPAELRAELKSLGNLKEIVVVYNRPVEDEDEAKDKANYDVDDHKVVNAELSEDKMSVTLLLEDELDQQEDVEVTLDDDLGFEEEVDLTLNNVKDTSAPAVAEVVAVGNGLLKVTFSEPVQFATGLSNYTIDGKLFGAAQPTLSDNGKTVEFDLTKRLSEGEHKLAVKDKVKDYADFSVEANETEFAVVEDTTAPEGTVKSATQIEVVIEFSEEVETPDKDDVDTNTSADIVSVEMDDDNKTLTIKFDVDDALPTAGGEITIEDLTDYSGNSVDFEVDVKPSYDVERPEFVGYTIEEDQEWIVLEFSEEVLPDTGVFELEDADDDEVDVELYENTKGEDSDENIGYYWNDDDDEWVKTKLVLVRKDGKVFASEKHTLVITEVADNNPLKNEIMKETVTIDVDDQEDPEVESVVVNSSKNSIYVEYTEEVDDDTATDYSSYAYTVDGVSKDLSKKLMDLDLLSDGKTVCIEFPTDEGDDNVDVDDIESIQIDSVTDLAGNEISTVAFEPGDAEWTESDDIDAPEVTSAKVTDENTIVVKIDGSINEKTVNPDDFVITAGKDDDDNDIVITAWDAEYNSDDDEITLTVNADIASDATYEGNAIKLELEDADDIDTVNAFESKLEIASVGVLVEDDYAPKADDSVASAVYGAEGTVAFIELTEDLALVDGDELSDTDKNQFRVKADGDTVVATIEYYDADDADDDDTDVDETCARLKIIIADDYSDDKVEIKFLPFATATIKDAAGNALEEFELSENVD